MQQFSYNMFKIALKKPHFKPYFLKKSGGPRPPVPPANGSALWASENDKLFLH